MIIYMCIFSLFLNSITADLNNDIVEACNNFICDDADGRNVCGLRAEGNGFRLKSFKNECELLKFGCREGKENAYGLINSEYCEHTPNKTRKTINEILLQHDECNFNCEENDINQICAIRNDGEGFRIRWFQNKCQFNKHNCESYIKYNETDIYMCEESIARETFTQHDVVANAENAKTKDAEHLIVVNSRMFDNINDINDTIDKFFAASHISDLPIKELETRRTLLKYAGPVKVFVPWIVIPKNISDDKYHVPTLSSCYHKCPTVCPDTYAPVCGVPGILAREPSLIFQNHCFMDVAQCKMFWEDKSSTAHSSSYIEASFLFCMGDEMNAVYRFLPAVRTLQKMGRLKKKGRFRAKLKNFRYINDFRSGMPKFMG